MNLMIYKFYVTVFPGDDGAFYSAVSDSQEDALKSVRNHLLKDFDERDFDIDYHSVLPIEKGVII